MTDPTTPTTDRRCINCGESIDAPRHSVWATERDGACHFEDGASVEKRAADLREWAHAADTAPGEWAPVTVLVFRRIEAEAAKRERERIVGLVEALERHICEPCEPDPEGWAIDRAAVLTAIREEQSHA